MLATTSLESAGRGVRDEHRAIAAAVEALADSLRHLMNGEPDAERTDQIVEGLESLGRQLSEHFAREEAPNGIFALALTQAPRLERRVRAVRRQHGAVRAELEQMHTDAGYAGLAPDAWGRVAERFRAFAGALRAHERAEDGILADAYLDDLGGGD